MSYSNFIVPERLNAIQRLYEAKNNIKDMILTEEEIDLDGIMDKIKDCIKNGFPMQWKSKFVLINGKAVRKECKDSTVFAFDWDNFIGGARLLNKVRFYFFISSKNTNLEFFTSYDGSQIYLGCYAQDYSCIELKKEGDQYFGSIFINLREFLQEWNKLEDKNPDEIFDQLEEVIFHEIRHYYDNIYGVFSKYNYKNDMSSITFWADECLSINEDTLGNKSDREYAQKLMYMLDETELNAYTQSFFTKIKKYIIKYKDEELTKDRIIYEYILTPYNNGFDADIFGLYPCIYNYSEFIKYIKEQTFNTENFYYYLLKKIMRTMYIEDVKSFDQKFVHEYLNVWSDNHEDVYKKFPRAFKKFMEKELLPWYYKPMRKILKKTYTNMENIIDFLLDKYNVKEQN